MLPLKFATPPPFVTTLPITTSQTTAVPAALSIAANAASLDPTSSVLPALPPDGSTQLSNSATRKQFALLEPISTTLRTHASSAQSTVQNANTMRLTLS